MDELGFIRRGECHLKGVVLVAINTELNEFTLFFIRTDRKRTHSDTHRALFITIDAWEGTSGTSADVPGIGLEMVSVSYW